MAAVIQRAFVPQARAHLCPLIEVGVCRLHAMAWELASGRGGVAPSASGFHWKRGIALNRRTCSWLEGRVFRTIRRDYGSEDDEGGNCTPLDQDYSHRLQA